MCLQEDDDILVQQHTTFNQSVAKETAGVARAAKKAARHMVGAGGVAACTDAGIDDVAAGSIATNGNMTTTSIDRGKKKSQFKWSGQYANMSWKDLVTAAQGRLMSDSKSISQKALNDLLCAKDKEERDQDSSVTTMTTLHP